MWKSGSTNDNTIKEVPVETLENALDKLAKNVKESVMAHLRAHYHIKSTNGYIQLGELEAALQSLFGEGSTLLMRLITSQKR
jgi:hypothetical protein